MPQPTMSATIDQLASSPRTAADVAASHVWRERLLRLVLGTLAALRATLVYGEAARLVPPPLAAHDPRVPHETDSLQRRTEAPMRCRPTNGRVVRRGPAGTASWTRRDASPDTQCRADDHGIELGHGVVRSRPGIGDGARGRRGGDRGDDVVEQGRDEASRPGAEQHSGAGGREGARHRACWAVS